MAISLVVREESSEPFTYVTSPFSLRRCAAGELLTTRLFLGNVILNVKVPLMFQPVKGIGLETGSQSNQA